MVTGVSRLSVVVPVYSGEAHLPELVAQLATVRAHLGPDAPLQLHEVLFVADEPIDGSTEVLTKLGEERSWLKLIILSRNFGQHAATVAGVAATTGDWVATIDEDLQHRPGDILRLLGEATGHRADLVYAKPAESVHGGWRDWSSRSFKRFMVKATGQQNIRMFNSFRVIRGDVARGAAEVSSHATYFDVALSWFTQRVRTHPVDSSDTSDSGYRFGDLLQHARRMAMSSDTRLLRGATLVGFAGVLLAIGLSAWLLITLIVGGEPETAGWLSLLGSICFFSGVISLQLSVLSQYQAHVSQHAHGRPTYFTVDRANDAAIHEYLRNHEFH